MMISPVLSVGSAAKTMSCQMSACFVAAVFTICPLPPTIAIAEAPSAAETGQGTSRTTGIRVEVQEFPFFPAPRKPLDLWAINFAYCAPQGREMIMSLVQCDYRGQHDWQKAIDYNQRMCSTDNGRTWSKCGPVAQCGPYESGNFRTEWMLFLDPGTAAILGMYTEDHGARVFYEISKDGGQTWSASRQVVHKGKDYDSTHWMPGIAAHQQGLSADQAPFARLDDGVIVCGFPLHDHASKGRSGVVFLRGRWNAEGSELDWDIGDRLIGPENAQPLCEPDLIHLGGQRLFTTMRCQGSEKAGIYTSRQCALSEDGGRTWSKPKTLKYDDGSPVFVPASIAAFERDPATGKIYWFANILDKPVYGQNPRTPLAIAEFDPGRLCLIKASVTPIIPPGTPKPPYSNFGHYVDRETGEFVIVPAEQIPFRVNFETDPYFGYRVKVLEATRTK